MIREHSIQEIISSSYFHVKRYLFERKNNDSYVLQDLLFYGDQEIGNLTITVSKNNNCESFIIIQLNILDDESNKNFEINQRVFNYIKSVVDKKQYKDFLFKFRTNSVFTDELIGGFNHTKKLA